MSWVFYGLMASLCFGAYAIPLKYISGNKFLNAPLGSALFTMAIGMVLGYMIIPFIFRLDIKSGLSNPSLWIAALLVGLLHAGGVYFVLSGLRIPNVNLAQMVPLFNTNTLVAFLLAILIFKELPDKSDLLRCSIGAIMIVIGAILISR